MILVSSWIQMNSQRFSSNVYEVLYVSVKVNKQNLNWVLYIGREKLTTAAYSSLLGLVRASEQCG